MPLAHLTAPTAAHNASLLRLAADGPVCAAKLPPSERLLLTLNALAFHGSSALHQALMSSPQAGCCSRCTWTHADPPPTPLRLVLQHQKLVQRGAAVLVANLARLVHDFSGFNHRLREFAPCLDDNLDDAFEPVLGTDIFLANQLKTGGPPAGFKRRLPCVTKPSRLICSAGCAS